MTSTFPRAPVSLVDIGANLGGDAFRVDLPEVLARARAAGVARLVLTGSDPASNDAVAELARYQPDWLKATAGLHPHHAAAWSETHAAQIARLLARPEVAAGGECGLDYFRDLAPREAQRRAFVAQLELTIAAGKPIFLHQREAHDDFIAIVREYRPHLVGAVVHCFTGDGRALEECLSLDCHVGITGWIADERRAGSLPMIVGTIPRYRLMIETDAPYLLPRNLPKAVRKVAGHRNEPAFLPAVLAAVALARGEDPDDTARHTTATACAFFGFGEPAESAHAASTNPAHA